jgi:UDP-N-acetyl-D-mannosaminuronic acid transferase (WecB/TagA/CpsF family)
VNGLKLLPVAILSIVFAGACGVDTEQSSKQNDVTASSADLLLLDGYVYTADSERSLAEAIAVSKGEIVLVGTTEDAMQLQGPDTRVDLTIFDGEVIFERQAHSPR